MSNSLTEQISELSTRIRQLHTERNRILQEWAFQVSPYKVGDITEVKSYSFGGKQCKVTRVVGSLSYSDRPQVRVNAILLKKDGTLGQQTTDWLWEPEDA